jgi:hypothetical protein
MSTIKNRAAFSATSVSRRTVLGQGILLASALGTGAFNEAWSQTATFDYYIGPNGSDSNPGTKDSPWAITALTSKRSTYAGKVVGFLDGTYNVSGIAPSRAFEQPIFTVSGGTASSPTVFRSVNPRGAHITAKTAAGEYTGLNGSGASEGGMIGITSGGNIVFDGLRLSGTKNVLIRAGTLPASTNVSYLTGVVVQNCELFDTNAVGTTSGENYCALTVHGCDGFIARNNYIHDIVGTGGPTASDHTSAVVQWGSINSLYEYNTVVRAAALYGKRGYGRGQWGTTIRYNYIDASNYGRNGSSGIADFAGGNETPVVSGTRMQVHNNVVIAAKPLNFLSTNGYGQRIQSQQLECYNNTCIIDTSVAIAQAWGAYFQISNPGAKFYNNVFWGTGGASIATPTTEFGVMLISNGPHQVLDYNVYPQSANKWSRFANGGSPYDGSLLGGTSLTAWRNSLVGLVGGLLGIAGETHSIQTSNPMFVGTGSFANAYKLQSASPLRTFGRVGGATSGATIEAGAWGGANRIGHQFSSTPGPSALQISVS